MIILIIHLMFSIALMVANGKEIASREIDAYANCRTHCLCIITISRVIKEITMHIIKIIMICIRVEEGLMYINEALKYAPAVYQPRLYLILSEVQV
jgi:hypothetical protein